MKLRGMTAQDIDTEVAAFSALMQKGMRQACSAAASAIQPNHVVAASNASSSGAITYAIDGLSVMTTRWGSFVTGSLMPLLEAVAKRAASTVSTPLGNVPAIKTEQFIADMTNMVSGFSADMWDAAKASLIAGAQDGESIAQLATRIENVANVKAKKAHVIAQTSVIAAINGGEWQQMMEAASAFDIKGLKEWEATEDSHTRPTHHAADGQRVPIDSHFVVGGSFLMFPGDPSGDSSEIISCRCTTLYDLDVDAPITASQTSPETLSTSHTVDANGQFLPLEDGVVTAAVNAEFNAQHPRGNDGKFIKKGAGLPGHVFDTLIKVKAKQYDWSDLSGGTKTHFIEDVSNITPSQWGNLKDEDKEHVKQLLSDALDDGEFGSAKASLHVEALDDGDAGTNDAPNVFDSNTALPTPTLTPTPTPTITTGSSTPIKITHGLIHAKHAPNTIIGETTTESGAKVTVTWTASNYYLVNEIGKSPTSKKKSQLYAYLASQYPGAKWVKKGKQETEVSHAVPLDAAPPPNPIPHPVTSHAINSNLINSFDKHAGNGAKLYVDTTSGKAVYQTNDGAWLKEWQSPTGVMMFQQVAPGSLNTKLKQGKLSLIKEHGTTSPHPVISEPGVDFTWPDSSSSINDELDDAFGPLNTGLAPTPDVSTHTQSAVDAMLNGDRDTAQSHINDIAVLQSPSTPGVAKQIDLTGWKKIGGQGGSNLGGLYESPSGEKFYVKSLKSKAHADNEVLAAALYNAADVNVPNVQHGMNHPDGWKNVIISPIVPNAKSAKSKLTTSGSFASDVHSGYAVDAWLANYDVVGLTHDNIVDVNGKPWRIDVGGSLLYRAQGTKKTDWNDDPTAALNGLKSKSTNSQAASVFGGMSTAEEKESAKKLLGITDDKIDQLVKDAGLPSSMADTLKARKKAILDKYGLDSAPSGVPTTVSTPNTSTSSGITPSTAFGDITGLSTEKMQELDKLWYQYTKGLMTTDELLQQVDLVKNGPDASTLVTPSSVSTLTVTAADISTFTKHNFYSYFKKENVSPAWSGAKIYKSMHVAKQKMSGAPQIAALSDVEMLKILDDLHNSLKGTTGSPYGDKVKAWLKTPNGQKAFKELNPAISTTTPSIAKKVAAKKLVSAPHTITQTPSDVLGESDVSIIDVTKKAQLYAAFKGAGAGAYLKSSPSDIFYTATQTAKANPGVSPLQILKIADEEGAKKFGVANTNLFENKIADWAASPIGKKKIVETYNDALLSGMGVATKKAAKKAAKKTTSTGQKFTHDLPLSQKVKPAMGVDTIPKWNPNDGKTYPVISTHGAASLWTEMQTQHGAMLPAQKTSLKYYTSNVGFTNMNNYLRGYKGATQATHNHVNNAQAGMRPTTKPIVLHRGNGWFTGWTNFAEIKAKEGTEFKQEAFFSASVGGKAAFGSKPIRMTIECPEGTPMAYVKSFSNYGGENEMLLAADLSYQIISVAQNDWQVDVHMRVIAKDSGGGVS
jgi:hypothetical protein